MLKVLIETARRFLRNRSAKNAINCSKGGVCMRHMVLKAYIRGQFFGCEDGRFRYAK